MMIPMIEVGQNASLILIWIVGLLGSQVDVACHCVCDQFFAHERDVKIPMWWFHKAHSMREFISDQASDGIQENLIVISDGIVQDLFQCFIDDSFAIWFGPKGTLLEFLNALNSKTDQSKPNYCISESSHNFFFWICFSIDRDTSLNVPQFSTFQKPLNKYLYIPLELFLSSSNKKAFFKGELTRYAQGQSDPLLAYLGLIKTKLVSSKSVNCSYN